VSRNVVVHCFAGRCIHQVPVAWLSSWDIKVHSTCHYFLGRRWSDHSCTGWLICTTHSILGCSFYVPSQGGDSEIPKGDRYGRHLTWDVKSSVITEAHPIEVVVIYLRGNVGSDVAPRQVISKATAVCVFWVLAVYKLHSGLLS
jgi:hypothetical protein